MRVRTGLVWMLVALALSGCEGKKEGENAQAEGAASAAPNPEVAASSENGGAVNSADAAAPAIAADKAPAETAAVPGENGVSVAEKRRQKAADALKAVYCAQRKDTGAEILPVYASHGFPTPADWMKAWDADAHKKPEWARDTLAALTPTACTSP